MLQGDAIIGVVLVISRVTVYDQLSRKSGNSDLPVVCSWLNEDGCRGCRGGADRVDGCL